MGHREDHRRSPGVEGPTVVSGPSFSDSLLSGISFTWNTCLHALQGTSEAVWPGGRSPRWRRAGPISLCDQRKQVPPSSPARHPESQPQNESISITLHPASKAPPMPTREGGGAVNPTVRVVAWNLSLCQIQSGWHSFHMSTQA